MHRLQKIAAWLCLVLAVLTGAVPAQSFVLCIEPDGCVSFEAADAGGKCGGCESHEVTPRSPVSAVPSLDTVCPCVDVTVAVSVRDERAQLKSSAPAHAALTGPFLAVASLPPIESIGQPIRPDRTVGPPQNRLTLIRSVVLLV
jgi:hypothetical protein